MLSEVGWAAERMDSGAGLAAALTPQQSPLPFPSSSAAWGSAPAPADNQGAHLKPRRQTGSLSPP